MIKVTVAPNIRHFFLFLLRISNYSLLIDTYIINIRWTNPTHFINRTLDTNLVKIRYFVLIENRHFEFNNRSRPLSSVNNRLITEMCEGGLSATGCVQTTVVIECTLVPAQYVKYFLFNFSRIAALSFSCVCFLVLNRYLLKLQCKQQIILN